jgi:sialic acid synthase SpsE
MSQKFILNKKEYNQNHIMIIAEACDNHFGSLRKAFKMVELAKNSGADVIKFQHHLPDEEMLKKVPKSKNFDVSLYDFLKKNSLTIEDHFKLLNFCKKKKITYLCTPFSFKAAEQLNNINVCGFNIGSGEMSDHTTIKRILKFNKPLIVSTGMSTEKEISETYNIIVKNKKSTALLNCLSEYPVDFKDLNLKYIEKMKKNFNRVSIGHSDHTSSIFTSIAAVSLGAIIIEKHVTLDKINNGPDRQVSIDFNDLKKLISEIRLLEKTLGEKKFIHPRERQIRKWAHRSIVTIRSVRKGEKVTLNNVWSKRPGTGIPSKNLPNILGKYFTKNIDKDKLIYSKNLTNNKNFNEKKN